MNHCLTQNRTGVLVLMVLALELYGKDYPFGLWSRISGLQPRESDVLGSPLPSPFLFPYQTQRDGQSQGVHGILVRAKRLKTSGGPEAERRENRSQSLGQSRNHSLGQEIWPEWRVLQCLEN